MCSKLRLRETVACRTRIQSCYCISSSITSVHTVRIITPSSRFVHIHPDFRTLRQVLTQQNSFRPTQKYACNEAYIFFFFLQLKGDIVWRYPDSSSLYWEKCDKTWSRLPRFLISSRGRNKNITEQWHLPPGWSQMWWWDRTEGRSAIRWRKWVMNSNMVAARLWWMR